MEFQKPPIYSEPDDLIAEVNRAYYDLTSTPHAAGEGFGLSSVCGTSEVDGHNHLFLKGQDRTTVSDGHFHMVVDGVVQSTNGHTHELINCSAPLSPAESPEDSEG